MVGLHHTICQKGCSLCNVQLSDHHWTTTCITWINIICTGCCRSPRAAVKSVESASQETWSNRRVRLCVCWVFWQRSVKEQASDQINGHKYVRIVDGWILDGDLHTHLGFMTSSAKQGIAIYCGVIYQLWVHKTTLTRHGGTPTSIAQRRWSKPPSTLVPTQSNQRCMHLSRLTNTTEWRNERV